ncbi:acetyltransferase [Cryobacterium sp. TMS1-20-1]|uniref:acetyltransferase n=1 Tax=Cryobacterium sp. TMS1-20-1 TaxID=1259223 RepID=UPI00141B02AB|nr:acetyltransferase [Cryobacterium sp. TMS1-20-1]
MSVKLIIVGAGGAGREVAEIARDVALEQDVDWVPFGFLDDDLSIASDARLPLPLLGSISAWTPSENREVFICAIGDPSKRERIITSLASRGAVFTQLIHPTARVALTAKIGTGVVVYPFTYISTNTQIGAHVFINLHNAVGHDAEIGPFSVISSFCDVTGNVSIGERVFLGSHVSIAPGLKIGDDAMLGMGSVVVTNVRARKRVFGNPARAIKV